MMCHPTISLMCSMRMDMPCVIPFAQKHTATGGPCYAWRVMCVHMCVHACMDVCACVRAYACQTLNTHLCMP